MGKNKMIMPPCAVSLKGNPFAEFLEVPELVERWHLRQKHVSWAGGYSGVARYAE